MDKFDILYWVTMVKMAQEGDPEATDILKQENEVQTELGNPSIIEKLSEAVKELKDK